ncbi:hypothetical protein ACFWXO_37860 [Kitasatospora sp. NPDC059088]|uniref:hypothetical protein n=1 Tax=Kitasatospora sp. NPDC059088 TaxID=3346722 RepID=UPI0036932054
MTDQHSPAGWNSIADHHDRIRHLVNRGADLVPATGSTLPALSLGGISATLHIDHYGVTHLNLHTDQADGALRQTADGRLPVQLDVDHHTIACCWPGGRGPGADSGLSHLTELTTDTVARHTTMPAATIVYGTATGPLPRHASTSRIRHVVLDVLHHGGSAHVLATGLIALSYPGRGDATVYPNPTAQQPRCRRCGSWSAEHGESPCPGFEPMTATDGDVCIRCGQQRAEHSWQPSAACDHYADDPWWDDDEGDDEDDEDPDNCPY